MTSPCRSIPGAKIGVVGPNGAGKSTILKIMAGLDTPSNGEAFLTPGFSVGILMQEPQLDETKTVLENIQLAFGDINAKMARYNEVAGRDGRPSTPKKLHGGDGHAPGGARPRRRLGPGRQDRPGDGRAALPAR